MSHFPAFFAICGWTGLLFWMAAGGLVVEAQVPNTLRHSFFAPKSVPQKQERQGLSVAISGTTAVVGAPFFDADELTCPDSGAVKAYDVTTGQLCHVLKNPDPTPFAYFGHSVAVSGSRVAVGSGSPAGGLAYAGRVDIFDLGSPDPTQPVWSIDNPFPGERDQFGHSLALDGDRLVVGAWLDDEGAINSGTAYVYDLGSATPLVPEYILSNPSPEEADCFGVAVAVAGDRVVVTAYQEDTTAENAGRAYVFDLGSPEPAVPSLVLSRPEPADNDGFGTSLAISGDHVVVGIETADVTADNSGSAIVFDLSSPTPEVPVVTLVNPAPAAGCYFGTSVSISGNTVAVGAYRDGAVSDHAGACHIYNLSGSTPELPVLTLAKPVPAQADFFGGSVSVSGSLVLVGASHDDTGETDAGSSYLFDLASGTPALPVSSLISPLKESADRFGAAVAISGSLVVVGSPDSDAGSTAAGRIQIHDLESASPGTPVHSIGNPDPAAGDRFGGSVSISGNLLLVGAAGSDTGATDAGRAYVFDLDSEDPGLPVLVLSNPAPAEGDGFGSAVSIWGNHLVVGAGDDDQGGADSGRAYLYHLSGPAPETPIAILTKPVPAPGDRFGAAVSLSGGFVVVGVPGDDTVAMDAGAVCVSDLAGNLLHTLAMPAAMPGDAFGSAVSVSAGRVAAGAPRADVGATDAGSVAVFHLNAPDPTVAEAILPNPVAGAGDEFGAVVAISGTRVVAGARLDDGPTDSGRAHSFNLASPTPTLPSASLAKSSPFVGDLFGASVAVDGVIVVVGTPSDNRTTADKGAAYVFGPAAPEIAVRNPAGEELHSGESVDLGAMAMGEGGGGSFVFEVINTGITGLAIQQVSVVGGDAADFTVVTAGMMSPLPPGDDTTFTVIFNPSAPGLRSTTLRIDNSDENENPFDILISGQSLSPDHDTDGDGLNDVAELRMASLGFDWQRPDPQLVAIFHATANLAGFYSPQQVSSLRLPPPMISKGPGAGEMTLTLWLEKSTLPAGFAPFPLIPSDTSITPQGELEFHFIAPGDTGFFRIETK
jgi:hypothetical protein